VCGRASRIACGEALILGTETQFRNWREELLKRGRAKRPGCAHTAEIQNIGYLVSG
jgi:hypothetical protein